MTEKSVSAEGAPGLPPAAERGEEAACVAGEIKLEEGTRTPRETDERSGDKQKESDAASSETGSGGDSDGKDEQEGETKKREETEEAGSADYKEKSEEQEKKEENEEQEETEQEDEKEERGHRKGEAVACEGASCDGRRGASSGEEETKKRDLSGAGENAREEQRDSGFAEKPDVNETRPASSLSPEESNGPRSVAQDPGSSSCSFVSRETEAACSEGGVRTPAPPVSRSAHSGDASGTSSLSSPAETRPPTEAGALGEDAKIRDAVKTFERASLESVIDRMQRTVLCLLAEKKETKLEKCRLLQERRDLDEQIVETRKKLREIEPASSLSASSSLSGFSGSLLGKFAALSLDLGEERDGRHLSEARVANPLARPDPSQRGKGASSSPFPEVTAGAPGAAPPSPSRARATAETGPEDTETLVAQAAAGEGSSGHGEAQQQGEPPHAANGDAAVLASEFAYPGSGSVEKATGLVAPPGLLEEDGENALADFLESLVTRFGPAAVKGVETAATKMRSGFHVLRAELAAVQERQRALERQRTLERRARLQLLKEESLEYAHHQRLLAHLRAHCEREGQERRRQTGGSGEETTLGDAPVSAQEGNRTPSPAVSAPAASGEARAEARMQAPELRESGEVSAGERKQDGRSESAAQECVEAEKEKGESEETQGLAGTSGTENREPRASSPLPTKDSASGSSSFSPFSPSSPSSFSPSSFSPSSSSPSAFPSVSSPSCCSRPVVDALGRVTSVPPRRRRTTLGSRRERLEKAVSSLSEKTAAVPLDFLSKNVASAVGSVTTSVSRWLFGEDEALAGDGHSPVPPVSASPHAPAASAASPPSFVASGPFPGLGDTLEGGKPGPFNGTGARPGATLRANTHFPCRVFNLSSPSDRSLPSHPPSPSGQDTHAGEKTGDGEEDEPAVSVIEAQIGVDPPARAELGGTEATAKTALALVVLATEQCTAVAQQWVERHWETLKRCEERDGEAEAEKERELETERKREAAHALATFLSKAEEESEDLPVRIHAHWLHILGRRSDGEEGEEGEKDEDGFGAQPEPIVA
ncbi:putative glutamic acid-rich protein [Neospora caninum Liverpool]|uniref:Glutamic acid-rich protein, putative n=1 Tax=Neospora caninum (strain Liverpool) TaxID=572307 RepID=F0VHX9_NEOCL|nr:putative glutamic acid-rich protein [Neospora caninum Liverpool]CBZ53340.1 putative glutamic acid-rich protein [Neospora caninum Liverpool]CEL67325.1 TPA: glutamic acid-rich protein, putative [Neospora caninum Liverpool]|eukprot:XP_003883372.1 putative glutamic acid-rich protein [Neospora caninum Liverpool]